MLSANYWHEPRNVCASAYVYCGRRPVCACYADLMSMICCADNMVQVEHISFSLRLGGRTIGRVSALLDVAESLECAKGRRQLFLLVSWCGQVRLIL